MQARSIGTVQLVPNIYLAVTSLCANLLEILSNKQMAESDDSYLFTEQNLYKVVRQLIHFTKTYICDLELYNRVHLHVRHVGLSKCQDRSHQGNYGRFYFFVCVFYRYCHLLTVSLGMGRKAVVLCAFMFIEVVLFGSCDRLPWCKHVDFSCFCALATKELRPSQLEPWVEFEPFILDFSVLLILGKMNFRSLCLDRWSAAP